MTEPKWETLATVADALSAQVLLERLVAEGVDARLREDTPLLGVARRCRILVPEAAAHRARSVLSQLEFSDEELASLAMGERQRDPR